METAGRECILATAMIWKNGFSRGAPSSHAISRNGCLWAGPRRESAPSCAERCEGATLWRSHDVKKPWPEHTFVFLLSSFLSIVRVTAFGLSRVILIAPRFTTGSKICILHYCITEQVIDRNPLAHNSNCSLCTMFFDIHNLCIVHGVYLRVSSASQNKAHSGWPIHEHQ
jgi:hypothetical protein